MAQKRQGETDEAESLELTEIPADGTMYYTYDSLNRLTKATGQGSESIYRYDGTGMRISKTVNGEETRQIWDGSEIVYETGEGRSTA